MKIKSTHPNANNKNQSLSADLKMYSLCHYDTSLLDVYLILEEKLEFPPIWH